MTSPTPAPSEDRFFMDWSIIRTKSPLVSISVRERWQQISQPMITASQPGSEATQMGITDNAPHEDLPCTTSLVQQQPLDRFSMIDERRMNDVGTNTSDVIIEPNRDRLRTSTMEANAQTSITIVDVIVTNARMYLPQVHWGSCQTLIWSLLAIYWVQECGISISYEYMYGVYLWYREKPLI